MMMMELKRRFSSCLNFCLSLYRGTFSRTKEIVVCVRRFDADMSVPPLDGKAKPGLWNAMSREKEKRLLEFLGFSTD